MNLNEISDPKVRRRSAEIEKQVNAATREQVEGLVGALTETDLNGRCFGSHDKGDIRCRRCWLEFPCTRLAARFQEWSKEDPSEDAPAG
jgi:hypothetical protein